MKRYDLLSPMSFFSDFDKAFADFFPTKGESKWKPFTQVEEKDKFYHLSLDIPGVDREHLNIDMKDQILSVKGERKSHYKNEIGEYDTLASFERSFQLPKDSNLDELDASLTNGVLDIVIPKYVPKELETKNVEIGLSRSKFLD